MGTNYYLTWPEKRCEHCGSVGPHTEQVHIGKSSVGWHFNFEATRYKTADEWRRAIELCIADGGWISNEYSDDEFKKESPEEFWELVKNKRTASSCHGREYPNSYGTRSWCVDGVCFSNGSFS